VNGKAFDPHALCTQHGPDDRRCLDSPTGDGLQTCCMSTRGELGDPFTAGNVCAYKEDMEHDKHCQNVGWCHSKLTQGVCEPANWLKDDISNDARKCCEWRKHSPHEPPLPPCKEGVCLSGSGKHKFAPSHRTLQAANFFLSTATKVPPVASEQTNKKEDGAAAHKTEEAEATGDEEAEAKEDAADAKEEEEASPVLSSLLSKLTKVARPEPDSESEQSKNDVDEAPEARKMAGAEAMKDEEAGQKEEAEVSARRAVSKPKTQLLVSV